MDSRGPFPYPFQAPVSAMAPRKRELLDVLRRQQATEEERPLPAKSAPGSAPFRFRFGPAQRRAWLRVGFAVAWIVLVVWLVQYLMAGDGPARTDAPAGAPAGSAAGPPPEPPAAARDPGRSAPAFGVLAITYQGEAQLEAARRTGVLLQRDLQLPDVQLHETRDRGKVWYELFVGRAADAAALEPLLQKVRGLSLPGEKGKPFATAFVKPIPSSNS